MSFVFIDNNNFEYSGVKLSPRVKIISSSIGLGSTGSVKVHPNQISSFKELFPSNFDANGDGIVSISEGLGGAIFSPIGVNESIKNKYQNNGSAFDYSSLYTLYMDIVNSANVVSKYEKSIEVYFEILDSGVHSSELYYNLGNSFYKLNDIPNSILFYEKSLKLNPTDKDIINNLKMVNNAIIDDITKIPEPFFDDQLNKISNNLSYSNWGLISLIISFLFLLLFIFYFFSKEPIVKRTSFTLLLVLLFLIGITTKISLHAYEKNHLEKYAIIFSSKIEIKSEPNERSENLLILHMGTKVKIIDSFNDKWVKIKLVNGQEGWINNNEIKII